MMINRDRYLIVKNILRLLSDGNHTGTGIMYSCRLSNGQKTVYLDSMIDNGLVKQSTDYKKPYSITGKGMKVLEVLERLYNLCPFIMDSGIGKQKRTWDIV